MSTRRDSKTAWSAIFAPSIADLFFLAAMVWLFVAGAYGWQSLLQDGDVGTHIRIGDFILAHHSVPAQDFLSFSRQGQEWYSFEWLTDVLFSALHTAAGLKGVVLFSGVVIVAAFTTVLLHTLWRGANVVIALALCLMAVNASSVHFHARPHAFTMLFAAVSMWLIEADRKRQSRAVWLLIPIVILWANLHAGFLILFAVLGLLVIGELAARRLSGAWRYSLLGLGCAVASLVNPYGPKLMLSLANILKSDTIRNGVQEFQSPSFRSESMFDFMIVLFLSLAITGSLLKRRRLTEVLWIWFFAYESLVSVRNVPLFMIVATPILALEVTAWWNEWARTQPKRSIGATLDSIATQFQVDQLRLSVWAPAFVILLAFSQSDSWPQNFLEGPFPVKIVEKHADEIAGGRIYTTDKWAGYLIYRNYPRQRVFFDDRHQYYTEEIIQDYLKIGAGDPKWRQLLDQYRLNLVLCAADSPLVALMTADPAWKSVEDDGKTALFRLTAEDKTSAARVGAAFEHPGANLDDSGRRRIAPLAGDGHLMAQRH